MPAVEYKEVAPATTQRPARLSIKNVLFATDFSPTSESALPFATAICRTFASTLHIAHVLSDTSLLLMTGGVDYVSLGTVYDAAQIDAEEKIQQVVARPRDIPCKTYVQHGQVWTRLSSIVGENAIHLIVVGTHGRTGLGKLLLGSVAEDILRHASWPVLTVGPRALGWAKLLESQSQSRGQAPADLDLRSIIYATNFSPASLSVAPVAIALAERCGSRLTLMHVFENYTDQEHPPGPIENGVNRLQAAIPRNANLAYTPEILMEFGSASERVVNTAVRRSADLIVLGARRASGTTHLPWSTVHQVVANAPCPVLTVPHNA
jgi:nucleotide-binding universal stress UspA family protein